MQFPSLSVVIPAFNEESFIAGTLNALKDYLPSEDFDVIVVDNGSSDKTADIASSLGAQVIYSPGSTIAALRNKGAKLSKGDLFLFIDADVSITEKWSKHIEKTITQLQEDPMIVTGSRCLPPQNNNWLNKYWFNHLSKYKASYINSGHLITTRTLFEKINGFTESLRTAEDYDFCQKAVSQGGQLIDNPDLEVIHYGYPETISAFLKRECWHGSEDVESWQKLRESKVALAACLNICLLVLSVVYSLFNGIKLWPIIDYLMAMFLLCASLSKYKFRFLKANQLGQTTLIFYLYLTGRSLSVIDKFFKKKRPS